MAGNNPYSGDEIKGPKNVERTPVVLIIDSSGSMENEPVNQEDERIEIVNEGFDKIKENICADSIASDRVDISMVTFSGSYATVRHDFTLIEEWEPPTLYASGNTPMYDGIKKALEKQKEYKKYLKSKGIPYTRPYMFLLSDGKPDMYEGSDEWNEIQELIEDGEEKKHFVFVSVALGEADVDRLGRLVEGAEYDPIKPQPEHLSDTFEALSNSIEAHSIEEGNPDLSLDSQGQEPFLQL